jgi:hypothetical protein
LLKCLQAMSLSKAVSGSSRILIYSIRNSVDVLVAEQFKASWRHVGKVPPPVRKVYKIFGTKTSLSQYDAYRYVLKLSFSFTRPYCPALSAAVESRGQFVPAGRSAGNENRRWHGTRRECNLGDPGNSQFCSSTTCSLCCIVRTSFDLSLFGKKTGWGR